MQKAEFLKLLDELLELPSGTLKGGEELADLERWDSMAAVDFLALADEHLELIVSPQQLANCNTVNDLLGLLGDRISE